MTYLQKLQQEIAEWAGHNFVKRNSKQVLIGSGEELGELAEQALELVVPILHLFRQYGRICHSQVKMENGVRGTREQHEAKMKDAIGDLTIFLIDFCVLNGWDYQEILEEVWSEVKERDWIEDPLNGLKRYRGQDERKH